MVELSSSPATITAVAKSIRVRGIVQGVGFRPFVYRIATQHRLAGHVRNCRGDVEISVEGSSNGMADFLRALRVEAPAPARIDEVVVDRAKVLGRNDFVIADSAADRSDAVPISPDLATCDECLRELFDENNRRFRYPLINCAQCGPRYTIVKSAPYDRERTSMAAFTMCPACRREFDDPTDRRFHAQAIACSDCGPRVYLTDGQGNRIATDDPVRAAANRLRDGRIVAVKGLGGYHLAVDAANESAVAELRQRKRREEKPFAVMALSLTDARTICSPTKAEQRLLCSLRRPIVLMRNWNRRGIAASVTGELRDLGLMLAYTPLHHILLADFAELMRRPALLVMTSGNRSDEPIACSDEEALRNLAGIADHFLIHNRPIENRCDDSVTRVVSGNEMVVRRSRGDVPVSVDTSFEFPEPVLACGADLKSAICIGTGRTAMAGSHVGDLENYDTLQAFQQSIGTLERLADIQPRVIAHDMHPDYRSTRHALAQEQVRKIAVQHHHAHIAGVIAEHRLAGPVIGVAFDGTGYGPDGCVWGGEFFIADRAQFTRAAHLKYVPMPGGELAIRQPWRMAAACLQQAFGSNFTSIDIPFIDRLDFAKWRTLSRMINRNINCPSTSSMGRLFDAVAAIVLQRDVVSFEGQAAMELEAVAEEQIAGGYKFDVLPGTPAAIDAAPVIRAVVDEIRAGVAASTIAGRFHAAVADLVVSQCEDLRKSCGLDQVALSGGVFQNRLLATMAFTRLRQAGFGVFTNNRIPVNDGGISFGQAAVAAAQIER